jgi:isohexenylglutaconyl-CoA hydratase
MSETSTGSGVLQVRRVDGFWFARLNRPERRNALSDELVAALAALCDDVDADRDARALVLSGAGGHFSAGADFAGFASLMTTAAEAGGDDPIANYSRRFGALLERLTSLPVATIAVVTGSAIGGGLGLAATCDRVIASDDASFAMTEVSIGVAPAQIAPFVIRKVGLNRARWLMLSATRLDARQAVEAGLVDAACATADLKLRLGEALAQLANGEPAALRATKRIVDRSQHGALGETLDFAAQEFARLLRGGRVPEGIAASRERRAPAWRVAVPDLQDFT